MKIQINSRLIPTLFITILFLNSATAQTTPVMQWSTHIDCHHPNISPATSKDRINKLRHTKDGGYIGCGYSQYNNSLHNYNPWVPTLFRLDPNGNLIWQQYYDLNIDVELSTWEFNDVVEDENGFFAAVGQIGVYDPWFPNVLHPHAILVITDGQGNILNAPTAILPQTSNVFDLIVATGVAATPDGKYAVTAGSNTGLHLSSFVILTDGYASGTLPLYWQYTTLLNNELAAIKVGNINAQNDYDLIAVGNKVASVTSVTGCLSCEQVIGCTNPPVDAIHSNVAVANIHYDGSTLVPNWGGAYVYFHSSFIPNYVYGDFGPYSLSTLSVSSNGTHCQGCEYNSELYDQIISNSQADLAADVHINQSGEIVVAAYTDFIWMKDQHWYNSIGKVLDCTRPCFLKIYMNNGYTYDEYKDANAWLMKLDYNSGNLIPAQLNNYEPNPAHIAHMSGEDFRTEIGEDECGNIYINGSTADNTFSIHSTDLMPAAPFVDMLVCKVDPYFSKIWRKHFSSSGLTPEHSTICNFNYDYECSFGLVANNDNSITVAGNNGENGDDAVITKLSSDEQAMKPDIFWDHPNGFTVYGTQNWSNSYIRIKGTVIVPAGTTLIIDNTTVYFAETRENVDYNDPMVNAKQCGIIVEKSGHLIIRNHSVLRGFLKKTNNDCSRDYMWDGITVVGDPAQPQNNNSQGWVEISTDSKIQDAHAGLRFDSKTWFNRQTPPHSGPDETWDKGHLDYPSSEGNGGGYVFAVGSRFENNGKDAEFLPYHYNNQNNISFFNACNFTCNNYQANPDVIAGTIIVGLIPVLE